MAISLRATFIGLLFRPAGEFEDFHFNRRVLNKLREMAEEIGFQTMPHTCTTIGKFGKLIL